jgi:hypothetical protein
MDSSAFDGIGSFVTVLLVTALLCIPLAAWKLIEVVVWLFKHVSVAWN